MSDEWDLTTGAVAREAGSTNPTVAKYADAGLVPCRIASNGMRLFSHEAPQLVREVKKLRLALRGRRSS